MIKKLLHIFAVSQLLNDFVNQKQSFFTYHKGIVPNSFYRKVVSGCDKSRGLYPHLLICKLFTNVTTSKQFTASLQGMWCRNVWFTKRTQPLQFPSQTYQRLWLWLVPAQFFKKRLCNKNPHRQKAILFRQRQNLKRSLRPPFYCTHISL